MPLSKAGKKIKAKLEKEYGMDQRDPINDFISSHPTAKERRNRVKKM